MKPLRVCLINPRFEPSYWGMDFALPLMSGDKRNWTVTGALPALAALAPPHCDVTLLDENVEDIDFEVLKGFDVIGVTGMIVQRARMLDILAQLQHASATIVVGGPYVSVAESEFEAICDVRFIGEAEETWPQFLTDRAFGKPVATRYEQVDRTDMATVPTPRYDLLKAQHYMIASLQFSRGCPFLCEFCDIITIFGRRPRMKTPAQMIAEFEAVRRAGFRHCFLVDDNFIGNKQKAKELLRALISWQEANGYPLTFSTEASINLADEPELMALMVQAQFKQVFIGIESPRATSLTETRKMQNVRGDSLLDKVQRVRDHGLVIQAGFIVGFDNDDAKIFDEQFEFIQNSGIAQALVGILSAIPSTPLHARLKAEGRLDETHPDINFIPKLMSRDALKTGYDELMRRLYDPDAYFGRLLAGYASSPLFVEARAMVEERSGRKRTTMSVWADRTVGAITALHLLYLLLRSGKLRTVGGTYLRQWRHNYRLVQSAPIPFPAFVRLCVDHWHYYNISISAKKGEFGHVGSEVTTNLTLIDQNECLPLSKQR